jgi:hypothetical protein
MASRCFATQCLPDFEVNVFFAIGIDEQLAARILIAALSMEVGQAFCDSPKDWGDGGASHGLAFLQQISQ